MPQTQFYPALNQLIDTKNLPDLVKSPVENVIQKLFYKTYYTERNVYGDTAYHHIVIVINSEVGFSLFGGEDGFELLFNPGTTAGTTEIPLAIYYNIPILKYAKQLKPSELGDPQDYFNLLLEILDISIDDIIYNSIHTFIGPDETAYGDFVQAFNTNPAYSSHPPIFDATSQNGEVSYDYRWLRDQFDARGIDILQYIFEELIAVTNDVPASFNNLFQLFEDVLGGINFSDVLDLLIPKFSVTFQSLELALAFPRSILQPVNPTTVEVIDDGSKSMLKYDVGSMTFHSENGIDFVNPDNFDLTPSQIGNTGLIIEITNLKLDLRRDKNIPEADADDRPIDFQGVYCQHATITLPVKWFKNQTPGSSAQVFGNDMLIGTGGVSGTLGLEAVGENEILWANIGANDGFKVGFKSFDIEFKQNKIISSNIQGAMKIKKFVYPAGTLDDQGNDIGKTPVTVGITGHIHDNGDFNLTASAEPSYPIELEDVFTYHIKSLELGGDEEEGFYIGTAGKIEFQGVLKDTLKLKAIEIDRLMIYSDGSIELEGGCIDLEEPVVLPLGPVEITVSSIHYGSHQKEVDGVMRKFNYFGFDGGISVDPLGMEIRGDGVKFYYCTDVHLNKPKPPSYLHIQTLYLDLTIPSDTPEAIINGWLSIPEPGTSKEYAGGIKLELPKAKITGKADMKLMPRYPAFIIDASINLPAPIPMGPVIIFGFRGLIGYRYVAEKEAVGLVSGVDSWYDYYKKPPRGIHVNKFSGPDRTSVSGTPFSIGAGVSLGTSFDNGFILNIKAMVLLSIPSLFMIDGRAALLNTRLGLDDSGDPPFFAFIAIGDNSLELGFGADVKIPSDSGDILKLYADVEAGFFFNDSSKWHINIGTRTNPVTSRVLTLLTVNSFVMLSSKGIEAGSRGEFNFYRKYGPIKVHAWAYTEIGGKVSFEKPQYGAYMAAGVGADINIKVVSLHASFNILFGVEAPKPFLIYGEFRYSVKIKIAWVFKFEFSGDLAVSWEFNNTVDRSPINPMVKPSNSAKVPELVKGVSMLSNETFELAYLGDTEPSNLPEAIGEKVIPSDTYIEIKTEKGLLPNLVSNIIGGVGAPAIRHTENIPPDKTIKGKEVRQVTHQFSIESIVLKSWNPQTLSWDDYHPYKALYQSVPELNTLKIGQFQLSDGQYNTIRLLATTPFSYTEQGQPGWYIPEQYGITPGTLFCEGEQIVPVCANFTYKPLGQRYYCFDENHAFYSNEAAFFLFNRKDNEFGLVTDEVNSFGFSRSLRFDNSNSLRIHLPEPSVQIKLKLTTFSQGVKIRYFSSLIDDTISHVTYGNPDPGAAWQNRPYEVYVAASNLNLPVEYNRPEWLSITRIEVVPQFPNSETIDMVRQQIAAVNHNNNLVELELIDGDVQPVNGLEEELNQLLNVGCNSATKTSSTITSRMREIQKYAREASGSELHEQCASERLCELYLYIVQLDPCFYLMKSSNWDREINCAERLLKLLFEFDKKNPYCYIVEKFNKLINAVKNFISAPDISNLRKMKEDIAALKQYLLIKGDCKDNSCEKNKNVCNAWKFIFDNRNEYLPHPQQVIKEDVDNYVECFKKIGEALENIQKQEDIQLAFQTLNLIILFIKTPSLGNYNEAWKSLQYILDVLLKKGNCSCDEEGRNCYTLLHEVCWLSLEAYQFNISIPGQADIEEDVKATIAGLTQYLPPIWRPDTQYYVHFVLKDLVDNNVANAATYPFTYGFSTGGPIGFFHTNEKATYGDYIDANGNTVEDANGIVRSPSGVIIPQAEPLMPHPEKYALTSLRQYIDYQRSYPNADGNLLSAKPLFYNDETTRIDLFFVKAYVAHFFHSWQPYNGQPAVDGRIKIVIKDPREGDSIVNPPYLDFDPADTLHTYIPQTVGSWEDDPDPIMPHVFDQYANLFEANSCIAVGGNKITPKSSKLVVVPKHLKPLKLYTALVNNLYDLNKNGVFDSNESREVHKFVFQTSRYATFKEQINSYILTDNDPGNPLSKNAVFDIIKALNETEVQAAYDTIIGTANALSDGLIRNYQHAYDRIVEGALGLKPIDEAISTEFNLVKDNSDPNDVKIIAIIVRNPEPFNNPKLPLAEVEDTIQVLTLMGVQDTDFKVLFSKDYSQAIIMRASLSISPGQYNFKFLYKIWDGSNYIIPGAPDYTTDEVGTILISDLDFM